MHEADTYIFLSYETLFHLGKCEPAFQIWPIFKAPILSYFLHVSNVILESPNSSGWIVSLMTFGLANATATYSESW
jgi:hypothetical protein